MDKDFTKYLARRGIMESKYLTFTGDAQATVIKVTDTIRLPYHLFFCVVLIYCLPLLCDYIHEEAPPIRIHYPMFL